MVGSCTGAPSGSPAPPSSPARSAPAISPQPSASPAEVGPAERERARVAELIFQGADFYDVPDPLTFGDRGALIRLLPLQDNGVARVYRVLYHSTSVDSSDVAVSGTIWVPAGKPPAGGFPIVAWGPGNNGSGDPCAYSAQNDVTRIDYALLMFELVKEGYAVAYTDYEGHGTRYPYLFAVGESATNSLLDAARAVRDLLGTVASNRVVVAGHSLGADMAAQTLRVGPDYQGELDVRGAGVFEGGVDVGATVDNATPGSTIANIVQGVAGWSSAYPELHAADLLTTGALADIKSIEASCTAWIDLFGNRPKTETFRTDPADSKAWDKRIEASKVRSVAFPVFFVVAPTSPSHVEDVRAVASRLCRVSDAVRIESYLGADHDSVIQVAQTDYFAWIADRFADKPAIGNCGE
jgi:pimeloyl-ACP methyl ester carboxylesterase